MGFGVRSDMNAGAIDNGRQSEAERAPLARLAGDGDRSAVSLGDALDEIQAQTAAMDLARHRLVPAVEGLEDVAAFCFGDSKAAILDGEDHRRRQP